MLTSLLSLLAVSAAAVPHFNVDLDVDPEERWREVILYYKDLGAIEALTRLDQEHPPPSPPLEVQQEWAEIAQSQLDEDYEGEIRGWVKYGGFNVTREFLLTGMAQYEMNYPDFCSGLLAAMPNGTVVHGRNMDYPLAIEIDGKRVGYPDITVEVTFLRGGRPLMTSVTWPGQLGIHTAMRFDGWTFEQNTRRLGDDLQLNTAAGKRGGKLFTLLARRVMERVPDFATAVQELWSADLAAPMYFIMSGKGPYEAAVLTMDRGGVHEPNSTGLMLLSDKHGSSGSWRLLQTNDDMTGAPHDFRRPLENSKLELEGAAQSQVSPEWVFTEMSSFPLKDPITVFTWIAIPATGFHRVVLPNETWAPPAAFAQVGRAALERTFLAPRSLAKI